MVPSRSTLRQRSELLAQVRHFFWERDFLEVETPLLAAEVIPELHIEPLGVGAKPSSQWLQASPELHMKRLVAAGMEAIFQVTRSFRGQERGPRHLPEFTLVEWYRQGDDLTAGMDLLDQFCQTVAGTPPATRTRYAAAFEKHIGLCPHTATVQQLRAVALDLPIPHGLDTTDQAAHLRDEWLNLLLAYQVEPQLGQNGPEILFGYPASQAALATVITPAGQPAIAQRFELYWQGVELANGYDELTDPVELRERLEAVNRDRLAAGRQALPLPQSLLQAMTPQLPACAGCALGLDRLLMLILGATTVASVTSFPPG